jgi:hypothetical protein
MALSSIASKQSKGTDSTMKKCKQLLNYLASHPNASVHFHASNMILNIHSGASYLSKSNAHSCACGHFFMGWKPDPTKPIKLTAHFSHFVQYYGLSLLLPPKPSLALYSSIANRQLFFNSPWKIRAIPNHPPQLTVIILPQLALPTIQSNGNVHAPCKCIFSGLQMQLPKESLTSSIFPRKKILQTIRASTIQVLTILRSLLGIYTNPRLSASSYAHASSAL